MQQNESFLNKNIAHFGIVNTTDNDCEQQVPSTALLFTTVDNVGSDSAQFTTAVVWRLV